MRHISYAILLTAAYGCGNEAQVSQPSEAAAQRGAGARYEIVKLESLHGAQSRGMAINDRGRVAGWADLPDGSRQAARWRHKSIFKLGTLGGPGTSSMVPWPGQNDDGMIVGISHTNDVDSLNEQWSCEEGGFIPETNRVCRGFVWENGVMRQLPTLGGTHGFAAGVNNKRQIVGWAETTVHDPTCSDETPQVLQFRAALWEPKRGSKGKIKTRQLRPFANDSTSAATAINDKGQAVGISGDCDQAVGRFSAKHAVLWDKNGRVREIPNLGGTTWHTPMDINERGDVVGFSNPADPRDLRGGFIVRAFLWTGHGPAKDLGRLRGDSVSQALSINARRQVVGVSFGGTAGPRAFIWENDSLKNFNDLMGEGNRDVFLSAQNINDDGQITGRVRDAASGEVVPFVATPIRGHR